MITYGAELRLLSERARSAEELELVRYAGRELRAHPMTLVRKQIRQESERVRNDIDIGPKSCIRIERAPSGA